MRTKYICDEPCPICGNQVQLYGTECYPAGGIAFECDVCDYHGNISVNKGCDCLMKVAEQAHRIIFNNLLS